MLKEFLTEIQTAKQDLLDELVNRATDSVIFKRRFRMLSQLAEFESIVIKKIYNLESNDTNDFLANHYSSYISMMVDKSA